MEGGREGVGGGGEVEGRGERREDVSGYGKAMRGEREEGLWGS